MHVHRSFARLAFVPALAVMLILSPAARAQSVPTTTVSGNVYQANGRPSSGILQISWPAFTTAAGQAVAAGRTSATIGVDGKVAVALAPNIGAMPAGLFYTAVYHLNDGTTSTEYWVVPNTIEATIGQVRSTVLPATQALQAVNKAYVDQSIAQAVTSQITPSGGTLTGPLYLAGDPTQAAQAANKHYVDSAAAQLLPIGGGTLSGPITAPRIGAVLQADQFQGADFGAQLQACVNALDPAYGGTCDARNFPGQVAMAGNLTLAVPNVTIYLPCSTIATAASILVPGGTRNVSLHGCASRGTSAASGAQGGTVLLYSGSSALLQVGDPSFLADTKGFRLDNAALNTTAAAAASAQAVVFYRTQEISLASLYLLGNANQTGMTVDGTGNYSGGTFEDLQFTGFQAAINGVGHTVDNAATTDWINASAFLRMHIDCPTLNGSPVAGTTGINLQAGDGNTFTGGDVEGCATVLHLGAHAVNNTLMGVRNENSTTQIQADAGSSYNNWMTGGTMYTGKLVDNGTRNSFLDTFHRSFNGVNGDWYGSQQDATVTNHFRLGIGTGTERGLLNRYQTDLGYRWTTGLSDGSSGIQYYQVLDELNHVYRLSLGQYNDGQGATNNQTALNAAGTGAVILNGSNNAGTGGVVFGSGGPSSNTVATVDQAGNANFLGTLLVGGVAQSAGTMTVRNNADAEVDYYLWPGASGSQKGSFTYKDFDGSSQWYMVKDQANNWALNSAPGGLDSIKAYQSTNSGDTYINAANSTGHIRLNYETGAGAETDIYSGSSSSLAAAFLGPNAIKFPGLAAASGKNCVQIDSTGYLSNTASDCGLAAAVATAGLAFSDGSVQTTSQQGALNGQANDATARSAASGALAVANAALPANGVTTSPGGNATFPGAVTAGTTYATILGDLGLADSRTSQSVAPNMQTLRQQIAHVCAEDYLWKDTVYGGTDIGLAVNAAALTLPVANGFHRGEVDICTQGLYQDYTTIVEPAGGGVGFDFHNAKINWNNTNGVVFYLGYQAALSSNIYVKDVFVDILTADSAAANGLDLTYNSVVAFALGGNPGYSTWLKCTSGTCSGSPGNSTDQGHNILLDHVKVDGAAIAFQQGNNSFNNVIRDSVLYNVYNMVNDTVCGTNSGERTTFSHVSAFNSLGNAFVSSCGYQYEFDNSSLDYSNFLSVPGDLAAAEITGNNIRVAVSGGHLEHRSGPLVYTNNNTGLPSSSQISFSGTSIMSFPSRSSATSANCTVTGPVSVWGTNYNQVNITATNSFALEDKVTFAGFTGTCAALNGQTVFVNHASLSSSGFIAYVSTSIATTADADTSAGSVTSVADLAPIVLYNPNPRNSYGDYIVGSGILQGTDAWTQFVDATNDVSAVISVSIQSMLNAGVTQVPIPPLYSYSPGVTGLTGTSASASALLADCKSGRTCFIAIGAGSGGVSTSTNGGLYLGVDTSHSINGTKAARIQAGSGRDLILGAGAGAFGSSSANGGLIDVSNWFGWGGNCSFTYTGTNTNTAATCPWAVDTHGIVHQLGNSNMPTASAGSIASGTNADGTIGGLSAATSVSMTFANGGWSTWVSCTASSSVAGNQPAVTATLTAVTFTFASEFTGAVSYHCGGK